MSCLIPFPMFQLDDEQDDSGGTISNKPFSYQLQQSINTSSKVSDLEKRMQHSKIHTGTFWYNLKTLHFIYCQKKLLPLAWARFCLKSYSGDSNKRPLTFHWFYKKFPPPQALNREFPCLLIVESQKWGKRGNINGLICSSIKHF